MQGTPSKASLRTGFSSASPTNSRSCFSIWQQPPMGPDVRWRPVFDLFLQSSPAADHSAGGLGLGLALGRQLVEMHGGSVSDCSAGLGQGGEFVVSLPRTPS